MHTCTFFRLILLALLAAGPFGSWAQSRSVVRKAPFGTAADLAPHVERCATVEMTRRLRERFPDEVPTDEAFEAWMRRAKADYMVSMSTRRDEGEVLQIPVVIHIIHNGEPEGSGFNISREQAESQILVLNEDFRRLPGSRGFNRHPDGTDTRIEFVLARRDPQGNATDGIVRHNRNQRGWAAPRYSATFTDNTIKPQTVWDTDRYFNFWCVPMSQGLFGYAQFPIASGLQGMNCGGSGGTAATDGVVVTTTSFGSRDGVNGASYNLSSSSPFGRTMTHEVGHYLSLRHIWGDANCGDDFCDDTPVHERQNSFTCPSHPKPNSCGTPDEMFENYMDYTADPCVNIFTRDQAVRMRATLLNAPRRRTLINSIALVPPAALDVSLISLTGLAPEVCIGSGSRVRATLTNAGTTQLTTAQVLYRVGNEPSQAVTFTGSLGTGDTAGIWLPLPALTAGTQMLTVYVSAPNGQPDAQSPADTLRQQVTATAGSRLPLVQNFELTNFPPRFWQSIDPNQDCFTWRLQSVPAGANGVPTVAAVMNLRQYTPATGQRDLLVLPRVDLRGDTSARLTFDYSFAASTTLHNVQLVVEYSTSCDSSWQPVPGGTLQGNALISTSNVASGTQFVPRAASAWRRASINLGPVLAGGQGRLRLVSVNGTGGNTLYLDNLTITALQPAPPVITALAPDSGVVGDTIRIRGTGLAASTEVLFNNRRRAALISVNDSVLVVEVPTGSATGPLRVSAAGSQATSPTPFRVLTAPEIRTFSPQAGPVGTQVTLIGQGLNSVSRVDFAGAPGAVFLASMSGDSLVAICPPGAVTGRIHVSGRLGRDSTPSPFVVGNLQVMSTAPLNTCDGLWLDPGGSGRYANNLNIVQTITPSTPGQMLQVRFLSFSTEDGYDSLTVFDGPTTSSPRIGRFMGGMVPPTITSSHPTGALTFRFRTDFSVVDEGWVAQLSCVTPPAPELISFTPILGSVGVPVTIVGRALGSVTSVTLSGQVIPFTLQSGSLSLILPTGAQTGRFVILSPNGVDTADSDFIVVPGVHSCTPLSTASPCGTSSNSITRVVLVGTPLRQTSGCRSNVTEHYELHWGPDSVTASIQGGGVYTLTVTVGALSQAAFWIDANGDGSFTASEFVRFSRNLPANVPVSQTFRVPYIPGQSTRFVRLRLRTRIVGTLMGTLDACSAFPTGETEDFVLSVTPCPAVPATPTVVFSGGCAGRPFDLLATSTGDTSQIAWYDALQGGTLLGNGPRFTAQGALSPYNVFVAQSAGVCQSERELISVPISQPAQAAFVQSGNTLTVQGGAETGVSYQWRLNNVDLIGATGPSLTATANGFYTLLARRGSCLDSTSQQITLTSVAGARPGSPVGLYPNPASDVLMLEAGVPGVYRLVDVTGRAMAEGRILPGRVGIPVAHLPSGSYRLEVTTEGASGTSRQMVPVQVVR